MYVNSSRPAGVTFEHMRTFAPGCFALCLLTPTMLAAQIDDQPAKPLVGARSLALSPDGKRLAFVYRGDIWVVPAGGGMAQPVTTNVEMEDNPVWSPDGRWVAFISNRYGNYDVFVAPADGGESRRLTWNSDYEGPSDWTPDGKGILLKAQREDFYNGLYVLDVRTTGLRRLMRDFMPLGRSVLSSGAQAKFSADGRSVLYPRFGFAYTRPRYQGSGAQELWQLDTQTGKSRQLRSNGFQHLWPSFGPNSTIYAVTVGEQTPSSSPLGKPIPRITDSSARTPNIYRITPDGKASRLTSFVGGGVRFLSVAAKDGLMAFEYEGDVYTMRPGSTPKKLAITATLDERQASQERLILTDGARQGALSPKGDRIAFEVRGELWMVPVKKGKGPNANDAKQLTEYPGLDQDPLWHPDGRQLYFASDREGSRRIYKMDVETLKIEPISDPGSDAVELQITPDGKRLSYWQTGSRGGLFAVPLAGGKPEKLFDEPGQFVREWDTRYAFSPDGAFVAYVDRSTGGTVNLYIRKLGEAKSVNVTRINAAHSSPAFTPDGKYLLYQSDRSGPGIYAIPLTPEIARATELEATYIKPTGSVKTEIDFTDIETRSRKLFAQTGADNIRVDATNGDIYFLAEGDVWKSSYIGEDPKRLTAGGGFSGFEFSTDWNSLFGIKAGALALVSLRAPSTPVQTIAFRADWTRDVRLERKAAFNEFWRLYQRSFYDPNFHGRDWAAIKRRYEPLLESVGHRNEMATVLNMMVGELETSHSEAGAGPGNPTGETSAVLGFLPDYSYAGPGIRIESVPKRSPGSYTKTQLKPGEYVTAINGKPVALNEALYRDVLNQQAGREITLTVSASPGASGREVKYRALSSGEWAQIEYQNRVEARRKYVEQKSGGALTYVHIAGMGGGNYDTFNQEAWEYIQGRKGVVIDVRANGGGNISDRLIDMIERVPHSYYQDRDEQPQLAPENTWNLPTVVLQAQNSFSNAEMFPYAMKQRKLATLVGMPTPGYVIWTYGLTLVDGTSARMPTAGVYRLDGSPLENNGQKPDVMVEISTEDFFAGRDPQLDKAIELLMSRIGKS